MNTRKADEWKVINGKKSTEYRTIRKFIEEVTITTTV